MIMFFTELNRNIFCRVQTVKTWKPRAKFRQRKEKPPDTDKGSVVLPNYQREYHYQIGVFSGFSIMRSKLL